MSLRNYATPSLCLALCAGALLPAFADTYIQSTQVTPGYDSVIISSPVVTESSTSTSVDTAPGGASTTTTTTEETTVTRGSSVLPSSAAVAVPSATRTTITTNSAPVNAFVFVDPITGELRGAYDPASPGTILSTIPSGSVLIETSTGRLVGGLESGRLVELTKINASPTLLTSIEARQIELNGYIDSALANGTITSARAAALRAQIAALTAKQIAYRAKGRNMDFNEAMSLAFALNSISESVVTVTKVAALPPLLGTRFMVNNGTVIYANDIDSRILALSRRIDDEFRFGRLSSRELAEFKQRLNEISSLESSYRLNGDLSTANVHNLAARLDYVNAQLVRDIATRAGSAVE